MNINYLTNISFDGRIKKPKLLPASGYNGPKLQLTEIDIKRISELEALKKAEMEKQAPVLRNLDIYLHKNLSSDKSLSILTTLIILLFICNSLETYLVSNLLSNLLTS